jgi:hypothetical protein
MRPSPTPSITPRFTPKPTRRRVQWSITTSTQWVMRVADSHRNRSTLHKLSFACPRTGNQDGPPRPASAGTERRECVARHPWFMGMPTAKAICCAIRGHPQVGFRCFMSTTAAMTSRLGPIGPGFLSAVDENSRRYFLVVSARWRRRRVEGFRTIAARTSRLGRLSIVQTPATTRSARRMLGARRRARLRISSCCFTGTDSATTARTRPGRRDGRRSPGGERSGRPGPAFGTGQRAYGPQHA